jgi:thioesterase domain-containing protein
LEKCQSVAAEVLEVFGEATAAIEPRQGTLDNPAHWQDHEAVRLVRALYDLDREVWQNFDHGGGELRSLIAGIGEQLHQEGIHPEKGREEQNTAVTILHIRGMHHRMQQQTYRVDQNMPLLPFDLLARVVPGRIDAGPPFSALFTLWLSITQAVGLASRPIASRHCSYSA